MDPMVYLNEDHHFQIFSYFDMEELAKCCRVSQKWHKFASQDRLWRRCLPEITVLPKVNIKKYINTCALISLNQLIQRIREFVDQLPLNKIGVLTCFFATNPKCKISMQFRYCGVNFHSQGRGYLKERVYIFARTIQGNNKVHTDDNHFLPELGVFGKLGPALVCHDYGDIESRMESIFLDEINSASERGGFLHDRFEMLLSKDHPLYPRACVCTTELQVL